MTQSQVQTEKKNTYTHSILHVCPSLLVAVEVSAAGLLNSLQRTRVRIVADRIGVGEVEEERDICSDGGGDVDK